MQSIRIGLREGQRVVLIADREGVSERIVVMQIVARKVTHSEPRLARRIPRVAEPFVPHRDVGQIAHRRRFCAGRARRRRAHMKWHDVVRAGRLLPHWVAVGQPDCHPVVEASHAAKLSEVVVERAVLLGEDHNMLDIVDRTRRGFFGNCPGFADQTGSRVAAMDAPREPPSCAKTHGRRLPGTLLVIAAGYPGSSDSFRLRPLSIPPPAQLLRAGSRDGPAPGSIRCNTRS